MVVFWKENLGRQPRLITPENEGDETKDVFRNRPSPPESQLIPIPISDDDDDQSPQEERQRERSRSRERENPHAQVPQEPQIRPLVTPEADEVSDEEFSDVNPSSPATGPPPSAEQRGRSRRDEIA